MTEETPEQARERRERIEQTRARLDELAEARRHQARMRYDRSRPTLRNVLAFPFRAYRAWRQR